MQEPRPGPALSQICHHTARVSGDMEGERAWAFTAPAFAHHVPSDARARPAVATYCPAGWRKRRRQGRAERAAKRPRQAAAAAAEQAPQPSQQPAVPPPGSAAAPPNPAQLVPLRCAWPHPGLLHLLTQQCWPAAGAAALVRPAPPPPMQLGRQPNWWNAMLPSLSLLHPPLAAERQAQLETRADSSSEGGSSTVEASPLPQPNVLVGYQVGGRLADRACLWASLSTHNNKCIQPHLRQQRRH